MLDHYTNSTPTATYTTPTLHLHTLHTILHLHYTLHYTKPTLHYTYTTHTLHLHYIYTTPTLHLPYTYTTLHLHYTYTTHYTTGHLHYTTPTSHLHFTYTTLHYTCTLHTAAASVTHNHSWCDNLTDSVGKGTIGDGCTRQLGSTHCCVVRNIPVSVRSIHESYTIKLHSRL